MMAPTQATNAPPRIYFRKSLLLPSTATGRVAASTVRGFSMNLLLTFLNALLDHLCRRLFIALPLCPCPLPGVEDRDPEERNTKDEEGHDSESGIQIDDVDEKHIANRQTEGEKRHPAILAVVLEED